MRHRGNFGAGLAAALVIGGLGGCGGGSGDGPRSGDDDGGVTSTSTASASTPTSSSSRSGSSSSSSASVPSGSSSAPGDAAAPVPDAAASGDCRPQFASGLNVAWVRFGNDVPNPDIATFTTLFQNTYAAGGRVVRWWFHADGTTTPGYDTGGAANAITSANIADVKKILDAARASGVMVNISLWSFDMLKRKSGTNGPALLANNLALLSNDTNRQAYIDKVLTPLVMALKGYPGLYSWEIFNEPEGMATGGNGWQPFVGTGGTTVDESVIQKTVNWFAAAIHAADPAALVTNGAWTFQACANGLAGMNNYYSDAALVAAGGKTNGTLDFYEVHYYVGNGSKNSPFLNPASHWGLDKPVVIGEFYALAQDNVAAANTYTTLFSNAYDGAWSWQYLNSDGTNSNNMGQTTKWPTMQVPMENLYNAHASALNCP
jgi:hypothetical protein